MKHIKIIWKDPVWSKVIAVGIIGLISFAYLKFESIREEKTLGTVLLEVLDINISLKYILISVLVIFIFYLLNQFLKRKNSPPYNQEHKELDKALLMQIKSIISSNSIQFLRSHSFAGNSYRKESVEDFFQYSYSCTNPEFEFIDPEINKLLDALTLQIKRFLGVLSENTWHVENKYIDAYTVPPEWQTEQRERFNKVVNEIHDAASEICKNYDKLILLGKRKLGI